MVNRLERLMHGLPHSMAVKRCWVLALALNHVVALPVSKSAALDALRWSGKLVSMVKYKFI